MQITVQSHNVLPYFEDFFPASVFNRVVGQTLRILSHFFLLRQEEISLFQVYLILYTYVFLASPMEMSRCPSPCSST